MPAVPDQTEPPRALNIDLYCLTCGYNLRGLSGDPVRCPECGNLNPIGDVELPAELITRQLRRMDPSGSIIAFVFSLPFQAMFWLLVWQATAGNPGIPLLVWLIFGIPAFALFGLGIRGLFRFRSSCLGKPGWGTVYLKYFLFGLLLVGLIAGVMTGGWLLACWLMETQADLGLQVLLLFAGLFIPGSLGAFGARYLLAGLQRRLTKSMQVLQREVAVTIARDESRKRLIHRRGRPLA